MLDPGCWMLDPPAAHSPDRLSEIRNPKSEIRISLPGAFYEEVPRLGVGEMLCATINREA
jgi:hypothetical protein